MTIRNINAKNSSQKKGGSFASAPTEDQSNSMNDFAYSTGVVVDAEPVTDPYGAGSNSNAPFVHAMSVELQQPSSALRGSSSTSNYKTKTSNPRLAQDDPQDPVQLARTETHTAIEMQESIRKKQCYLILVVAISAGAVIYVILL